VTTNDSATLATWLKRFATGWVFSLLLHCVLLCLLASLITTFTTEGPLTLAVSMVDDEASDVVTVEISEMEFDSKFDALETIELENEAAPPLLLNETDLSPEVDIAPAEPLALESLLDSSMDDGLMDPVNLGTVGLDESDGLQSGNPNDKTGAAKVKFFGLESSGNRFIFVVDCSGSMGDERRFQRALYELTQSMEMLKTKHKFLVILYNTETIPMLGMNETNIRMISATLTNKRRVIEWLKRQVPTSQTTPSVAMRAAITLNPSSIYFLSDGEFQDNTVQMLDMINVEDTSAGRKQIPINTITLGSTGIGAPAMRYIAEKSGGGFHWVQ
jgi:hypothetical protein